MTELVDPMWDLFSTAIEDESTVSKEWQEILPDQTVSNSITTYDINTRNLDVFYQIQDAYLEIRGDFAVTTNGSAHGTDGEAALVNNAAGNFFSRASLSFNGVSVEDVNYCGVTSLVTGLSEYSQEHLDSHGSNMMFDVETNNTGSLGGNSAMYDRKFASMKPAALGQGTVKKNSLWLPLKHLFGYAKHNPKALRGLRTSLRLTVSDNADQVFRGNSGNDWASTFTYDHISLWIPQVVPSLVTLANIEKRLNSGAKVPVSFLSNDCYRSDSSTLQNRNWRVTTQSQRPRRIYVALQNTGVQNSQTANNMAFETKNLMECFVRVNGKQHPQTAFTCDFTEGSENWVRAYNAFARQKDDVDSGTVVSYQGWHDMYPIYCIDVSHTGDSPYQNVSTSDIEVHIKLRTAPGSAYCIYAIIQSEREIAFSGSSSQLEIITL
jgi:hypothetical protein